MRASDYLSIRKTPKEKWQELNQATVNAFWKNTTLIKTIREQIGLPFVDSYQEYEAWVDLVADNSITPMKVASDFLELLIKDLNHINYRGQYYKISLDDAHEETYICYDAISHINQVPTFKVVRCNNTLKWIDDGVLYSYPCYLGNDISSTNNLQGKSVIVSNERLTAIVQANENTKTIRRNQRFVFNGEAFKVEEINKFMQESGTNGEVTFYKIYLDYDETLESDDLEDNIAEYKDEDLVPEKKEEEDFEIMPNNASEMFIGDELVFYAKDYSDFTFECLGATETSYSTCYVSTTPKLVVTSLAYSKEPLVINFTRVSDGATDSITVRLRRAI